MLHNGLKMTNLNEQPCNLWQ